MTDEAAKPEKPAGEMPKPEVHGAAPEPLNLSMDMKKVREQVANLPVVGESMPLSAKPAADVAAVGTKWTDHVTGRVKNHILLNDSSKIEALKGAAKQTLGEVKHGLTLGNGAKLGERGIAFARVGGVVAGGSIALGAFKSKNADGTDRGALHRLGDLVLGTGIAAGSVLAGGRA